MKVYLANKVPSTLWNQSAGLWVYWAKVWILAQVEAFCCRMVCSPRALDICMIHVKATSTWKHSCKRVAWQTCLSQLRRRHRIDDTGFYIPLNIIKKARRWENVNGNVNSYYKAYVFILAPDGSPDLREPAQSCGAVVSRSLGQKRLEKGEAGTFQRLAGT